MLPNTMIARETARAKEIHYVPGHGVWLKFPEGGAMLIPEPLWQTFVPQIGQTLVFYAPNGSIYPPTRRLPPSPRQ